MEVRILAVGDVVGTDGMTHLLKNLRPLKQVKGIDHVIVNGENTAGVGILPEHMQALFGGGVDLITLGNHTYGKRKILPYLDDEPYLLRPANYGGSAPGHGTALYDCGRYTLRVINLQGRCGLDFNCDNPFTVADRILKTEQSATFTVVDFHAEATSEKRALGYFLDGRVNALWGTHTHVQTADEQVLPKGTAYLTDLGMTGPLHSVIGMEPEQSVAFFLGGVRNAHHGADGPCAIQGAIFTLNTDPSVLPHIERIDIR